MNNIAPAVLSKQLDSIVPGKSVYLLNKTAGKLRTGAGDINIFFKSGDVSVTLKVSSTWVPIDASQQVDTSLLQKNPIFRSLVMRGLLEIISEAQALTILASPEAQVELQRITDKRNKITTRGEDDDGFSGGDDLEGMGNQNPHSSSSAQSPVGVTAKASPAMQQPTQQLASTGGADSIGMDIIGRFKAGELSESETVSALKGVSALLSANDLSALLAVNLPEAVQKGIAAMIASNKVAAVKKKKKA